VIASSVHAFVRSSSSSSSITNEGTAQLQHHFASKKNGRHDDDHDDDGGFDVRPRRDDRWSRHGLASLALGLTVAAGCLGFSVAPPAAALAADAATAKYYDGFAEYAAENQMEQSDVACFIQQCGEETKALFSNPRGIKGVVCLGRCKGEQACATRCFAEFSSDALNDWLSCTIEDHECVKVPKNIDNSAEEVGYSTVVRNFDPSTLIGTWYKTDGLNPNYDLFDCQTNTFTPTTSDSELDMGIFFRIRRPEESGGGFWENALTEHMVVDASSTSSGGKPEAVPDAEEEDMNDMAPAGRTMHTSGKMYGLTFSENWYILGESDGKRDVPPFKLVAYKGHTLQGNYEGAFVYAKEPVLPEAARPAVREAAAKAGLDFDQFTRIDNTCPAGEPLNDSSAGMGTSPSDWINLVIGEGGVIDWIKPGWRGEYKQ
jgi:hypothetical protein